jgi:class 3 adenylate cyclase
MERPDTCYVDSGGASIAYQEFGSGAIELAFVMFDAASHLEVLWEEPRVARIFERLGRFARVVMFDRRGTGLSDPAGDALTLEQQTDDLFAVLDAVGFERPAFVGASASAGRLAVFAAATHPERVSALVLIGSSVTGSRYWDPDRVEKFERLIASVWGTGRYAVMYVPSLADDARFLRWLGRFERNALSPGMARRLLHLSVGMDLSDLLASVRAPTLVIHRRDDTLVPIERGRELAAGISGARLVELEGRDNNMIAGDTNAVLDEIEEFLTGARSAVDDDTVLATVLFTDIVDSTRRAAALGDRDWSDLLAAHDRIVRGALIRYRGEEVKTLGDGFLAIFDGPARAIRCAQEIERELERIGISARAGLHTGEIQREAGDVRGLAVHIAARIGALATPSEVLVSTTVRELVVGSGLSFQERGSHTLKGVPGTWRLLCVVA